MVEKSQGHTKVTMYGEVNGEWAVDRSQLLVIIPSCLAPCIPSFAFPFHSYFYCEPVWVWKKVWMELNWLQLIWSFSHPFQTGTILHKALQFMCSGSSDHILFLSSSSVSVSFTPFLHCLYCPLHSPSPSLVKQQSPCESKRRKLPIKTDMYLSRESQGGRRVCIKANERVIWRYLSWTG